MHANRQLWKVISLSLVGTLALAACAPPLRPLPSPKAPRAPSPSV